MCLKLLDFDVYGVSSFSTPLLVLGREYQLTPLIWIILLLIFSLFSINPCMIWHTITNTRSSTLDLALKYELKDEFILFYDMLGHLQSIDHFKFSNGSYIIHITCFYWLIRTTKKATNSISTRVIMCMPHVSRIRIMVLTLCSSN